MKSKPNNLKDATKKLTPRELLHEHIQNADHHITDEDLKNLEIGPGTDDNLQEKEAEKLEEIKGEMGTNPPNPYIILND